jgi:hypothetical protein
MCTVRYFVWLAVTMALLTIAVLGLTIATDPYRTFGMPAVTGWTELKPRAYQQIGIAKLYQLDRIAPNTLVLGNSRTEIGLDPTSPKWPATLRPVFNAAVAGGNVYTSLLMLREDLALRRPEAIVLGLDFLDFMTEANAPRRPTEDEQRLLIDEAGHPNAQRFSQIWKDRLASTLTINAVTDSIMTLLDQNPVTNATMTPLGFNPLHDYRLLVARNGYEALFAQKISSYRRQYVAHPKPDFAHFSRIAAYRHLTAILKLAMENRIPMVLYIHPYHADFLTMLDDLGLWESFENWKRVIVNAVEQTLIDTPGDIRIFDFSGFTEFTAEPVPAPGDRHTELVWYWEPGHYKSALGEHMLSAIFHHNPHFGHILTPVNIEAVLSDIRAERTRFVDRHALSVRVSP